MASILVYAIYMFAEIISAAMIIRALLSWFVQDAYLSLIHILTLPTICSV